MVRSALYILAAIVAVAFGFDQANQPAFVATSGPEVSVRLTQAETDCIVGGDVGCLDVAAAVYGGCVLENYDPERPETRSAFIECGVVGLWSGIVCVVTWLWDWLF
jgi:hypothetical protein